MKNTLGFIIFVLAVLGFLFTISGKRYARVPDNTSHKTITDATACMGCHGAGREAPLKETHPPKYECFKCHKVKRVQQ